MKALALPALYLVYKGLTSVSPIKLSPEDANAAEEERRRIEAEERQKEWEKQQAESKAALDKAEKESVARQREQDRIAAEEKKEFDRIAAEEKQRLDNLFFQQQAEIRANPPDCGKGRTAQLRGAGTRNFPYSWECILTGF
jgi:Fic family protein